LQKIALLEGKFEIVCKLVFEIRIKVSQVDEEEEVTGPKEEFHDSTST
jgi:hypothetical protein